MRILILTPNPPYPPQSGGALRAYGILRSLRDAGHEMSLLCFADSPDTIRGTPLPQLCNRIITTPPPSRTALARLRHLLMSRDPDLTQRMYSPQLAAHLVELCAQDFDVIQFEGLEMGTYLPIAARTGTRAKLIYDSFNAEYALQQNIAEVERSSLKRLPAALYSTIQARRIHALEKWLGEHADGFIVVSPEDAALLAPLRGKCPLPIVPSGIFVDDYRDEEKAPLAPQALVFTGKMDYRPNVDAMLWFVGQVYPKVRERFKDAHLYIVGKQPSVAVQNLTTDGHITVTGQVPKVTPYLRGAAVYIAPLRMGSGTRLKLLEAMACGCAIVATEIAAAGLDATTRAALCTVDTPEAFAAGIENLLQNEDARTQLGVRARDAVRSSYDWSAIVPRLTQVYREMGLT